MNLSKYVQVFITESRRKAGPYQSMRYGELTVLRWSDITFESESLHVGSRIARTYYH
ncbi:MAG: hypothetical protein PVS3B3_11510 [Ktedonobacteraceae bacterium]